MKTFTIHLESHDDVASTMDKISWCKGRRFLLVWPKRSRLMQSRLDLVRIQRYCAGMGAQVGIVTQDAAVEGHAVQLGIPVFKTVAQANRSIWRRGRGKRRLLALQTARHRRFLELKDFFGAKRTPAVLENRFRKPAFISAVCAVLLLALFFLPSADVNLAMAQSEQRVSLRVQASPEITTPNINGGIPAYVITMEVDGQDQEGVTGNASIPDQFASGVVTFTNLTDRAVLVPAGTIVMTLDDPPVRFETLAEVQVAPGVGETAGAAIQAQQPGQSGNVEAGRIKAVAGEAGSSVLVDNPEAAAGGSDSISPAPSQADYDALKERLLTALDEKALEEIESSLAGDKRLLPATLKLEEVLEEKVQPQVGQPGDRLSIQLKARYSAWYILPDELEALINTLMDGGLAPGTRPMPAQLLVLEEDSPLAGEDGLEWQVTAARKITAAWKEDEVISAVLGKRPAAAVDVLSAMLRLETPPAIRMHPAWWPRLPFLPAQINVEAR